MRMRKWFLATVLAALSLVAGARWTFGQNTAVIPAPETPKIWGARWLEKLARVKQGSVDLIFVGDSISEAWDNGNNQPVWSAYYGSRNALSLGFSGARTENLLWMLDNGLVDGIAPKVAVVMIGTNNTDWKHFPKANAPEEIREQGKRQLEESRAQIATLELALARLM